MRLGLALCAAASFAVTICGGVKPASTAGAIESSRMPHIEIDMEYAVINQKIQFMEGDVLGVDTKTPRFSWQLAKASPNHGNEGVSSIIGRPLIHAPTAAKQVALQVTVFAATVGSVVWTSGRVNRTLIHYTPVGSPIPLVSDFQYEWEVVVWLANASSSGDQTAITSNRARFQTGLMDQSDWQAQWITGGNMYRTEVQVSGAMTDNATRATAFVSACQYYQLYVNGERVSDSAPSMGSVGYGPRELDVGWTDFDHNRSYATLDMPLSLLMSHTQPDGSVTVALGLMVGMGFCSQHQVLLQLQLAGPTVPARVVAGTNSATWNVSAWGPIQADSTYFGETYDARREQPGFSSPGFAPPAGSVWARASAVGAAAPTMSAQTMQPIRRVAERSAVSFSQIAEDRFVFDFGQEAAGWARLQLPKGVPAGTNATLKFAEALQHEPFGPRNGSVWMGNLFWAYPVDHYIAKGDADAGETYEPRFTYHGFRYVEVLFVPPLPQPLKLLQGSLTMVVLRTSASATADLSIDDPTLQGISRNSWWTEAAALMSIPAGCAGRGERSGWIGDAAFASQSELFDFDAVAMYTQWLLQVRDAQCPDGGILNGVPSTKCVQRWQYSDPSWQTVYPTVASNLARFHGAAEQLREHYSHLQLYMQFLRSNYSTRGLAHGYSTWGDWNPAWPAPHNGSAYNGPSFVFTSPHITAAASYVHDHLHMAAVADALGLAADASMYRQQLEVARAQFHAALFDKDQAWYGEGTVVSQAVALWVGAVPAELQAAVVDSLVSQVAAQDYSMASVGFIGVRYLFEALSQVNRTDVALKMLLRQEFPSYGYAMNNEIEPATALWESADVFSMTQWLAESSRDHHYQASIRTYLRQYVAGLLSSDGAATWVFRPEAALVRADVAPTLNSASLAAQTMAGNVTVAWSFPLGRAMATAGLPAPPQPAPPRRTCSVVPQFPVPNGGLRSPFRQATLLCPADSVVQGVGYAWFGKPMNQEDGEWTCYGAQPPPKGMCQTDVSDIVLQACANRTSCTLNATAETFGNPCNLGPSQRDDLPPEGYQLAVRVSCTAPAGSAKRAHREQERKRSNAAQRATLAVFQQSLQVPVGSDGQVHVPIFAASQRISAGENVTVWQNGVYAPGNAVPGISPLETVDDDRFVHFLTDAGVFEFAVWL